MKFELSYLDSDLGYLLHFALLLTFMRVFKI